MKKSIFRLLPAFIALALATGANAQTFPAYTQAPGGGANISVVAFSNIVAKYTPYQLEVNAGLSGSQYMVGLARGQAKFGSVAYSLGVAMRDGEAPFEKLPNASELWQNVRLLFAFPGGHYHFLTYADSGIESFADLKGRTIHPGPPNAAQALASETVIEASAGLQVGEDYDVLEVDTAGGQQAFQDGNADMIVLTAPIGGAAIEQYGAMKSIRFLGIPDDTLDAPAIKEYLNIVGRKIDQIPPGTYSGQVNEEAVNTIAFILAVGAHKDVDQEIVREMMTAFLNNFEEFKLSSKALFGSLTKDNLFEQMPAPLHAGAVLAYRDAGIEVPDHLVPPELK